MSNLVVLRNYPHPHSGVHSPATSFLFHPYNLMLRRGLKQVAAVPLRSGGHPDFPFVGFYKQKRYVNIYDANMWFYDGVAPEYIVDQMQPQLTGAVLWSRNIVLGFGIPMAIAVVLSIGLGNIYTKPYQDLYVTDTDEFRPSMRQVLKDGVDKKIFSRKHPLGHLHDYQNEGWDANPRHWLYKQFKLA